MINEQNIVPNVDRLHSNRSKYFFPSFQNNSATFLHTHTCSSSRVFFSNLLNAISSLSAAHSWLQLVVWFSRSGSDYSKFHKQEKQKLRCCCAESSSLSVLDFTISIKIITIILCFLSRGCLLSAFRGTQLAAPRNSKT